IPCAPFAAVEGAHPHGLAARNLPAAHPATGEVGGGNSNVGVRRPVSVAWRPEIAAACISAGVAELVLGRRAVLGIGVRNPAANCRPLAGGKTVVVDRGHWFVVE